MKRFLYIFAVLIFAACDNGYLELDNIEELVVEGWIESGHAPVVLVSSTLPISSTPQPLTGISEHILRYAEVYIDHNGERDYLTACLSDRFVVNNYFTSPTLRGVPGETYRLSVKWLDFEASAVCTIPDPAIIDSVYFEKAIDDTSYVAKMTFYNDPKDKRLYQSFCRLVNESEAYEAVDFTSLDGTLLGSVVVETFTKPLKIQGFGTDLQDVHFHPGDTLSLKLATMEQPMFEFWREYTDRINSAGEVLSAPKNIKGNVTGAIGYWAGYGVDIRELICE